MQTPESPASEEDKQADSLVSGQRDLPIEARGAVGRGARHRMETAPKDARPGGRATGKAGSSFPEAATPARTLSAGCCGRLKPFMGRLACRRAVELHSRR